MLAASPRGPLRDEVRAANSASCRVGEAAGLRLVPDHDRALQGVRTPAT
jgi:hypothetical protein